MGGLEDRANARGSSPRVRGTLDATERQDARCSVHPRGCGEHETGAEYAATRAGSSPRVRGTPRSGHWEAPRIRFIPAGAGNTRTGIGDRGLCTVHPRGCGEHLTVNAKAVTLFGSSPRVRGTLQRRVSGNLCGRFIPAGAGNTAGNGWFGSGGPVHPRGCGEHFSPIQLRHIPAGSSPRVRGTLPAVASSCTRGRFIPAGAGNTLPSSY